MSKRTRPSHVAGDVVVLMVGEACGRPTARDAEEVASPSEGDSGLSHVTCGVICGGDISRGRCRRMKLRVEAIRLLQLQRGVSQWSDEEGKGARYTESVT